MRRRSFIALAGGGIVLAAATAASQTTIFAVPASATAAWRDAPAETELRRWVLAHALLAPNPHNMQPWIADLAIPGEITLRLDPARLLPATDPFGRQILMGTGAFLELLTLAAAERDHRAEIDLFPQGAPGDQLDSRPFARVRLVPDPGIARDPLFAAIPARRTDRRAYDPARLPSQADLANLEKSAAGLPVRFATSATAPPTQAEAIRRIVRAAWETELSTPPAQLESLHVLRAGSAEIDRHRDGIALTSPFPVLLAKTGLFDRTRAADPQSQAIRAQVTAFDATIAATPAFLWLVTEGNTRALQVAAGRAYARVNLAGTLAGLMMHPNQQSLQEYPEVAPHHAAIHTLLDAPAPRFTVQMLARLGYLPPGVAATGPAPRRGFAALAS